MTTNDKATLATEATDVADKKDPNTVQLDTPIKRGDGQITSVTLRKPTSGELRGVSLAELLQMKVDALQAVLPRITNPMLHKQDMASLDPADLVNLGTVVVGFLLTKDQKKDFLSE
jgi:hypothetical protein